MDNSVAAFFDTDDPTYGAYLQYRDDFESDEVGYIVYRTEGGAWDLAVMQQIEQLTRALEDEVPFVKEVTSLSNVEFMEGAPPDDILVYDLLADFPETQEELFVIRDKVMKKPIYVGGLVSANAELGAVIVEMSRSSIDPVEDKSGSTRMAGMASATSTPRSASRRSKPSCSAPSTTVSSSSTPAMWRSTPRTTPFSSRRTCRC